MEDMEQQGLPTPRSDPRALWCPVTLQRRVSWHAFAEIQNSRLASCSVVTGVKCFEFYRLD